MPVSIPAFLSYLLLIGSAHAQVSAPNCTDNTFTWVGSVLSGAHFVSITIRYSLRAGVSIDVQLSPTKSLLGHGVSGGDVQQWQSVDSPLGASQTISSACTAFSVPPLPPQQSYIGPNDADKGDVCKCNTVVYNLISACDACQAEAWTPCVDRLCFCLHSNQSTYLSVILRGLSTAPPWRVQERKSRLPCRFHERSCSTFHLSFPNPVPLGTRVPKWAYIDTSVRASPLRFACFSGKSHRLPSQIGDNWNISAAQAVGGARPFTHKHTHYSSCLLVQIPPRLREPFPFSLHRQSGSRSLP
jgi:hypothetical protein